MRTKVMQGAFDIEAHLLSAMERVALPLCAWWIDGTNARARTHTEPSLKVPLVMRLSDANQIIAGDSINWFGASA